MPDSRPPQPARRALLKLGVTIGAGLVVPGALTACRSDSNDVPDETFVEPLELRSKDGLLDITLTLAYLATTIEGTQVTLRNMYGTIPAPTLRVRVGDTLRIKVLNRLPPNPPSTDPTRHLRYPNSTNLHTHGLHVYPDILRAPTPTDPGLYGDFVVDDPDAGIQPGEDRQYEYAIRDDHPCGTYWYHPHLHGSSAMQVGSGMAGALIIEGPTDDVPEIKAAEDRVFVFQAPYYDATGKLESFAQVGNNPSGEPPFIVNGVRVPRIVMLSGEVQHWRFINAGIWKLLNLTLDGHDFHKVSHDGNPLPALVVVPPVPAPTTPPPNPLPEGVVLGPGNRTSVLVKAGLPGTYQLRTAAIAAGRGPGAVLAEDVLAEVVIVEGGRQMALPTGPLPVTPFLAPITDEEFASHGGLKRTIVMRVIGANPDPVFPALPFTGPSETPLVQPPPGELQDWVYQTDLPPAQQASIANKVFALGSAGTAASTDPGLPTTFIPFQSSKALTQTVALDSVEEWTIVNNNNIRHPFHIHVNPMYVVAVNGKAVEPYWADTIALPASNVNPDGGVSPGVAMSSITFRMRFLHFSGRYVMHCHMLVHEDMGMMQGVTVVA